MSKRLDVLHLFEIATAIHESFHDQKSKMFNVKALTKQNSMMKDIRTSGESGLH